MSPNYTSGMKLGVPDDATRKENMKPFAVVFLLILAGAAMSGAIDDIRALYGEANALIESEELFRTEVRVNSAGTSFPGVGIFNRNITFFWAAEPWSSPAYRLVKAHVSSQASAVEEYAEYLFDQEGGLVFCYMSGGYDRIEHRFYYSGGRLVRFIDAGNVDDSPSRSLGTAPAAAGAELRQAFSLLH